MNNNTRPSWMEEDIKTIIEYLEIHTRDYFVRWALENVNYDIICDCIEDAWKERSARYSATWMDVGAKLEEFIGHIEYKVGNLN